MSEVRILNSEGIRQFQDYLNRIRSGEAVEVPMSLLNDSATSEPLGEKIEIEQVKFGTKLEAAQYFSERFAGIRDVDHNPGLWSWLALFYFDQLCPVDGSGQRQVREDARYIPGAGWRRYYRHLIAAPYRVYRSHGDNARLLLLDPVDNLGDIWEQLASRQEIITNLGILGAAALLYLDTKKDRHKRGVASTTRKPGTLRRFVDLVQQLDLTYDLYSMEGREIVDMLPREFDNWRPTSPRAERMIVVCPSCSAHLRLPKGRTGTVSCPACGKPFRTQT